MVKVVQILLVETLTPSFVKENTLTNTENPRSNSKKGPHSAQSFIALADNQCIRNLEPFIYCIYDSFVT